MSFISRRKYTPRVMDSLRDNSVSHSKAHPRATNMPSVRFASAMAPYNRKYLTFIQSMHHVGASSAPWGSRYPADSTLLACMRLQCCQSSPSLTPQPGKSGITSLCHHCDHCQSPYATVPLTARLPAAEPQAFTSPPYLSFFPGPASRECLISTSGQQHHQKYGSLRQQLSLSPIAVVLRNAWEKISRSRN